MFRRLCAAGLALVAGCTGTIGDSTNHPGNGQGRTRRPQTEWIPVRVPAIS